eukprot:gene10076-10231_t
MFMGSSSKRKLLQGTIRLDMSTNAIGSTRDYIMRAASASDPVSTAKTTAGAVVWGTQAVQTILGSTAKPSAFDERPSRKEVFKRARVSGEKLLPDTVTACTAIRVGPVPRGDLQQLIWDKPRWHPRQAPLRGQSGAGLRQPYPDTPGQEATGLLVLLLLWPEGPYLLQFLAATQRSFLTIKTYGPVLPHDPGDQLLLPPLLAMFKGIQGSLQGPLNMLKLPSTDR